MVYFINRVAVLLLMTCVSDAVNLTVFLNDCEDTNPECYELIPPCLESEELRWCPKTCGACFNTESVLKNDNRGCVDNPGCMIYSFPDDCSSKIFNWPREHCLVSCNLCPIHQISTAAVNFTEGSKPFLRNPDITIERRTADLNNGVDVCIDRWPYCQYFALQCSNMSVSILTLEIWCQKTCGFCKILETKKKNINATCEDDVDCSSYDMARDCPSNNTWFRDHCAKSCNSCLSVTTLQYNTIGNEVDIAMDELRVTYNITTIVVAGITAFTFLTAFALFLQRKNIAGCRIRHKPEREIPDSVKKVYSRVDYQAYHVYNEAEEESMTYSGGSGGPETDWEIKSSGIDQTDSQNEYSEVSDVMDRENMTRSPYLVPVSEHKTNNTKNDDLQPLSVVHQEEHDIKSETQVPIDFYLEENKNDNYFLPGLLNDSEEK